MNRKRRIEHILIKEFPDFGIKVNDNSKSHSGHGDFDGNNETHINVILKYKKFNNLSRLSIHRKIHYILDEEFKTGLHSLEIKIIK
tara:strand:+ start:462 stop:719 length:258 start_codon:yes stop_codon:yes gene_type:complete